MPPHNPTLAVAIASHNRRETTLACLRTLHAQTALASGLQMRVYLLDDGSSDGTSVAVAREFPSVQILSGDGTLFWNRAMRRALAAAMARGHDLYLLLNDDVLLDPTALQHLLETSNHSAIVVGATRDPQTGTATYGGLTRSAESPLKFQLAPLSEQPAAVDTFNGNCVLIPASVVRRAGNLDRSFTHTMGDIDYGLRAKKLGCPICVAAGSIGVCAKNPQRGNWTDESLPTLRRLELMMQPKGLPPLQWLRLATRHGGASWPLLWAGPYFRMLRPNRHPGPAKRPTLAILVNIVSPYRIPMFSRIASQIRSRVFVSGHENNRDAWASATELPGVSITQSLGVTVPIKAKRRGRTFDVKWLHLNPGYLLDLIRSRPRAVISSEMGLRTLCALLYGTLFRKPVWVWWGGTLHTEKKIGLPRATVRWLISHWARRWISYGQTSTEYLQRLGVRRSQILQIQNCANEEAFSPRAEASIPRSHKPVLLYAGQMIGRKGVSHLLESAARVQNEGLDFSLLLVGSGPERDTLEKTARELGLNDVRFLPSQPPQRMAGIYRSADCLIFPTLQDVWGLVVNEALLCGVPVMCSIYAGCAAEIVPEQNTFDPLLPNDFDRALRIAIRGQMAPAQTHRLKTSSEVADLISTEIQRTLAA